MFLIAKGFDNGFLFWLFWVELQCMGRDILSKDYGEQGYWLFITNFLIVEFDLTNYKIHRGLQSRLGKTRHICLQNLLSIVISISTFLKLVNYICIIYFYNLNKIHQPTVLFWYTSFLAFETSEILLGTNDYFEYGFSIIGKNRLLLVSRI